MRRSELASPSELPARRCSASARSLSAFTARVSVVVRDAREPVERGKLFDCARARMDLEVLRNRGEVRTRVPTAEDKSPHKSIVSNCFVC
jgi:hypothetical protein